MGLDRAAIQSLSEMTHESRGIPQRPPVFDA